MIYLARTLLAPIVMLLYLPELPRISSKQGTKSRHVI